MNNYTIWYIPIWGFANKMCKTVKAINESHALILFYQTKDAENCNEILFIEY
jgi:hypothetical protein